MEISERKSQMLYKNESGGRIMVRISLPKADSECELDRLYRYLSDSYLNAAREYIGRKTLKESFFLEVRFDMEKKEKDIKIKRLACLRQGAKTLKTKILTDVFDSCDFSLKK